jgi:hypothetical protein
MAAPFDKASALSAKFVLDTSSPKAAAALSSLTWSSDFPAAVTSNASLARFDSGRCAVVAAAAVRDGARPFFTGRSSVTLPGDSDDVDDDEDDDDDVFWRPRISSYSLRDIHLPSPRGTISYCLPLSSRI